MAMTGALGPSVWVASDGRAGNERQAMAVSRALGEMGRWMRIAHIRSEGHRRDPIKLEPKGWQVALPADKWPFPLQAIDKEVRDTIKAPWPSLWIGAGRRTAPFSRAIRKWSDGETLTVHILDPKTDASDYDLLVTPEHDEIKGENVITTVGSPAYFAPEDIEEVELHFADMAEEVGFKAAVNLGGDSNGFKMSPAACDRIEAQLRNLAAQGARLRITCSRRTPTHARVQFREMADDIGARFWESPADGRNPYLANLLMSDIAIVTEESSNMISEAAYFGLPIYGLRLDGKSPKFDRLHKSFEDHGALRWLDGEVDTWRYEPLREVDRVADAVVAALVAKHPTPELPTSEGPRPEFPDRR